MNEFKVGDWVILLNKDVHKVEAISKNGRVLFLSTHEIPQADNWWGVDQCKPWQPKEGEWCWFQWAQPKTANYQILSKFKLNSPCGRYYEDIDGMCFDFCEPFIGTLPSFLKDK